MAKRSRRSSYKARSGSGSRRRSYGKRTSRRTGSRRGSGRSAQTVRIVIEQPQTARAGGVVDPDTGVMMVPAAGPRLARF